MNRILTLTIISLISFTYNIFAEWIPITSVSPAKPSINAISSNIQTTVVNFNLSGFYLNSVQTPNGEASIATVDMASQILEEGAPDLAKLDASIIIPDEAEMQINVLSSSFRDFPNVTIAPSKGNFTRDIDPNSVPYRWGRVYQMDRFYPEILSDMREPYIMKDYRGQTILTYPFQYNPVTRVLRVYYDMTVEVSVLNQAGGWNQKNRVERSPKINTQFKGIYRNHFINFSATRTRYTPVEEQGRMIVISHGPFMEAMQPFVNWKNQKGIPTTIVNVTTIGNNTTSIKNYIQTQYNLNDGLTFVLLVGDATQIVTPSAAGGSSDPSYALLEGSDNYPDIFVGRFSAENVTQVQTQVTKTVHYERDLVSGDWLKKGMGVASEEGAGIGDNGESDWQHMDNIRNDLLDYTYSTVDQVYATNGGNATTITNNLNYGRTEICYCGHGSATTWVTTGYSNTNVNALTNDWKLPYIHSVACVNGQFAGTTCFAEAWLRATNNSNGNPTGAVAMYASSINQSWAPPMRGQDEYIDLLADEEMSSVGGLWYNSSCGMMDAYGTDGANMYKTWHIFGDPSLQVKTDTLSQIAASYLPNIMIGMENFEITTDAPNSLVCLSNNYEIISYGYADNNGFIDLDLINLPDEPTDLILTITALNRVTVVDTIELIPSNVPFLLFNSFSINDSETGNGNGQADYGENVKLTVNLRNVGSLPADSVSVTLSSDSPFITFVEGTANYLSIGPDSIYGLPDGFEILLNKNVPDMEPILINIQSVCQDTLIWNSSFQLIAHAPLLELEIISVLDPEGNNNGKLDVGETAQVTIQIKNNGSSDICNAVANLNSVYELLEIEEGIFNYDTIAANTS
ncbi:MAG TPA: C25 family cysteine peptidase, partial [Candidatus Kapabacteria bacterium]|nr:C25 family cysteine peptidase [Candidatus Kapabacteria bacterium]